MLRIQADGEQKLMVEINAKVMAQEERNVYLYENQNQQKLVEKYKYELNIDLSKKHTDSYKNLYEKIKVENEQTVIFYKYFFFIYNLEKRFDEETIRV